ncbi:ferredoxin [Glycomyces algeriensis]|jgi:ferredoxin|uniref:Ferredoxin n=1 Tax=Glycomyces algeriensis TaxID=256037 RepID=A0A9W6GAG8_9ACTN|nr:ferredoxin [Glycomyces algeriensis]MDA1364477.1 ferredoxin [Glycomyces algeriensis]MDR7350510.1 ferredoxin [Glycomyces algeriensis]GLI43218.1 ferredoxin [Glycomyces algeriensis]
MKVRVDRSRCQVLAQCVFTAPDVFGIDDEGGLVYDADPDDAFAEEVEQAARACPLQAILID